MRLWQLDAQFEPTRTIFKMTKRQYLHNVQFDLASSIIQFNDTNFDPKYEDLIWIAHGHEIDTANESFEEICE